MDKIYYDCINLKKFSETISDYLHYNNQKKICNVRRYFSTLLGCINEDVKESYLNRILKYLSSSTAQSIAIIDDFNDGIYDKNLMKFANILSTELQKTEDFNIFIKKLDDMIIVPYLSIEEYNNLKECLNNKDYDNYLFILIKHTFKTYKISLPNISSQRMLEEALTIYFDTEFQKRLINESAKLGNHQAIILFGNLNYSSPQVSLNYYLKAKKNKIALWEIGYMLETGNLTQEVVELIKKEIDFCIIKDSFINNIVVDKKVKNPESIKLAFQIYYYIISNFEYSKAFNSIGKLLLNGTVSYKDDKKTTNKYIKQYLLKAIRLGNINAPRLLATYFVGNPKDEDYNESYIMELLRNSADMGEIDANYEYGMLLKRKKLKQSRKYLMYAAEQKNSSACYELAQMFELKGDYKNACEYYKRAIYYGRVSAVYDLCLMYIELANSTKQKVYIFKATQMFDKYKKYLTPDIIEKLSEIIPK